MGEGNRSADLRSTEACLEAGGRLQHPSSTFRVGLGTRVRAPCRPNLLEDQDPGWVGQLGEEGVNSRR